MNAPLKSTMTGREAIEPENSAALISKISHDVRNSVRALLEVPNWIQEDMKSLGISLPDEIKQHFNLMLQHARRLDQMERDCTTYFRIGHKQGDPITDLTHRVDALVAGFKMPDGFEITQDIQIDAIAISEADLTTLLSALIDNAVKHHHQAEGRIHVTARAAEDGCKITVTDDGPGIAASNSERVFKVLTTLRPRDEVEGSGMGLAIALKIVTQYGGTMQLRARPDATGCIFELWLPEVKELS